ncbi:c-type cytochrome [Rubrolithibacter danxiaensis]|uniref:c-type cytochrome n=1 Tax=Rubrolithibacter danxiaensis TaxID=3390805 RepID=UPI003BF90E2B
MKKTLIVLALSAVIAACGNNSNSDSSTADADSAAGSEQTAESRNPEVDTSVNNIGTETPATAPAESSSSTGDVSKGKELIAKSDCLSCHKEHEKLVGPAYADVAKKYEATDANIKHLVEKVIKGGAGVWGDVPMSPHPSLSEGDVTEMVKYVLSVK